MMLLTTKIFIQHQQQQCLLHPMETYRQQQLQRQFLTLLPQLVVVLIPMGTVI